MTAIEFLRDTLWVLYALYFKPTALRQRLRANLTGLQADDDPKSLLAIADKLDQPVARRHLAQVALLCALAAMPVLALAPAAPQAPRPSALLLTFLVVWSAGLGLAAWDNALGLAAGMSLALLAGGTANPAHWLEVLASQDVLSQLPEIGLGLLIGLGSGLLTGGGVRWLARRLHLLQDEGVAVVVAGGVAVVVAGGVAVVVAGGVAGVVAVGVAGVVAVGVVGGVVGGVAGGVAVVVAFGVAGGVVGGVVGGMVGGVAVVVAFGVMVGVAVGVAGGVAVGVAVGVVGGMAVGVAVGVVGGVAVVAAVGAAGIVADMPVALPATVWSAAAVLGLGLVGTRPWRWRNLVQPIALLVWLALVFLPQQPEKAVLWLLMGAAGFFRLPLLLSQALWSAANYARCRWGGADPLAVLSRAPWHWDELTPLPLPYLDRLLVLAGQQDRTAGLAYIEEAASTWRQGGLARRALIQLAALELAGRDSERSIAGATAGLAWLPETLPPTVEATLGRFRAVSRMVDDKLALTDSEAQLAQLSATTAALDDLIQGLTFVPPAERALFLPIAQSWREVLRRATGRLPNPYVAGDPLRQSGTKLFVGREDVLRQLKAHLRDRTQRPALLLFGQRRMGKSTLLYQLPDKLTAGTLPVRVDCQAGEMQESNQAFLFNLARAIHVQATEHRTLDLLAPPSLSEASFTAFSLWLEAVEAALDQRVLLLCLDEFERLGEAVAEGWLDERVLGFLRNLIQHHPQVNLLLAGSHRPDELGRPWSDYLISVNMLEISYLEPKEARPLIERPIPGFPLHYHPAAVDHIIHLTRCQPLLVQLLCQELVHLLNERGEREAGIAEVEAAVPRALERGGSLYFTYLREYDAGPEGSALLAELARRAPGEVVDASALTEGRPEREDALARLLARDLVERTNGGIRFEIELVHRWWSDVTDG